jgi:hypothetical protein
VEKSAGNSDLEKLMIEFFHLVERVSSTELWWDRRGINRFIGLFLMKLQETHSKFIDGRIRSSFSKADFGIAQTQLIDGR